AERARAAAVAVRGPGGRAHPPGPAAPRAPAPRGSAPVAGEWHLPARRRVPADREVEERLQRGAAALRPGEPPRRERRQLGLLLPRPLAARAEAPGNHGGRRARLELRPEPGPRERPFADAGVAADPRRGDGCEADRPP